MRERAEEIREEHWRGAFAQGSVGRDNMIAQALRVPASRSAIVTLVDGGECVGRVQDFAPDAPELLVEEHELPAGRGRDRRLPTSSVACVAFRRTDASAPRLAPGESPALRVHLAGGRTWVVTARSDPADPQGFFGVPVDADSAFDEIFFFAHGMNALERDESLVSMLVEEGALSSQAARQGLERQAALHRKRIGEILLEQSRIDPEVLGEALSLQRRKGVRIGEVLIEAGFATREDIEEALVEQRRQGGKRIGEILVEMGVLSERSLALTLARKFHLPFVDLDACAIDPAAIRGVPSWIIEKYGVLPLEIDDGQITLALSDPLNTEPIDLIRFHRRAKVREVVAVPSQLERYLKKMLTEAQAAEQVAAMLVDLSPEVDATLESVDASEDEDQSLAIRESDNAIIRLANQILVEAVTRGVSDVHIEPNGARGGVRIRFRIDGECVALPDVPASHRHALISRLKIMANLDIAERRRPQDGRIRVRVAEQTVDLRVATLPTVGGEDVVLRVLGSSKPLTWEQLDLSERNRRELERLMAASCGLILCVGPTGSGKTTSLHSLLRHVNTVDRKIWTAEDPIEIAQPGLRQVEIRPKIGLGFVEVLRAFLRADPDVIMIGEMRDLEAASIAIRAALTGHLVLSTLHTNGAPETVTRLIEMGLDPFAFGDALLGVLAQRLARRLCDRCRSLEPAPEGEQEALRAVLGDSGGSLRVGRLLWRARGCEACRGTGYRGRIALHELLVVDDDLRAAIHARANPDAIRALAVRGGTTGLLEDGARKCLEGATDLAQVMAACGR